MPLRTILGGGDEAMLSRTYSALDPRQVVLAGVRELDEAERSFAEQESMQMVTATELRSGAGTSSASGALHTALRAAGSRNVYVHIDFDVLDPAAFPGVHMPAAGGLTVDELEAAVAAVTGKYRLVGASMVELAPAREPASGAEIGDAVRRLYGALWGHPSSPPTC
jgi:arginase